MVQATGNANGGGVQDGFAREAYQVVISDLVTKDSNTPTPRHINRLRTTRTMDFDPANNEKSNLRTFCLMSMD